MYRNISPFLKPFILLMCLGLALLTKAFPIEYAYTKSGFKYAVHKHNEASYQHAWYSAHNGIEEFENEDFTRVDCLTKTHAVEFDFSNKWAESIGQVLHYSYLTGKRGKVVLILEDPKKEMVYFKRVQNLAKIYDFDVEYITDEILKLDKYGHCRNINCKCQRKGKK